MARGGKRHGAGRREGSKGRLNKELASKVEAEGKTPLEVMLEIMRDVESDKDLRLDAAGKAAPYIHKKMPTDVNMEHRGSVKHLADEELIRIARDLNLPIPPGLERAK